MGRNFSNLNDLLNHVKRVSKYPLEQVAVKIEETIKKYIMENQYNWNPKDYSRTFQYINSLSVSQIKDVGSSYNVKIYFDTDKIIPMDADEDRTWNKHEDIYGNATNDLLPYWLEYGVEGNPYYNQKGNHAIQYTLDDLENMGIHIKGLMKELKNIGIDCKII